MKFYFALIELDDSKIQEQQATHIAAAMNELKFACNPNGKTTYYEVKEAIEFRRVEREIQQAIK